MIHLSSSVSGMSYLPSEHLEHTELSAPSEGDANAESAAHAGETQVGMHGGLARSRFNLEVNGANAG